MDLIGHGFQEVTKQIQLEIMVHKGMHHLPMFQVHVTNQQDGLTLTILYIYLEELDMIQMVIMVSENTIHSCFYYLSNRRIE